MIITCLWCTLWWITTIEIVREVIAVVIVPAEPLGAQETLGPVIRFTARSGFV